MVESNPIDRFSPSDQIRLAEAEVTRMVMAAREDAQARISNAQSQANSIRKQARQSGTQSGLVHSEEIISKAKDEALTINRNAQTQAAALKNRGLVRIDAAVAFAYHFVLGLEQEGGADEPGDDPD